ncbi:hypothetical protein [Vagococcus luciliae]|uniref:Uncharacterized protein n=1 Tax=Vagococcus luciliae TaxID=2920380 RepID=A0ABY5P2C7_9ENTE|nr:hypothetical protein [Vagococcus luciliae]UUV99922.1 hypothetical protein G314FT_20910 [Vagococcus luciliae]
MTKGLKIETLAQTNYKKCDLCDKVKDIFFKLFVYDAQSASMIVGTLDLCKFCGENAGDLLSLKTDPKNITTDFTFNN